MRTTDPPIGVITSSGPFEKQICRSEEYAFVAPPHTVFMVEDSYYGVTPSGNCEPVSHTHCRMPMVPNCNMEPECDFNLFNDVAVDDCQGSNATYIYIIYSFIPGELLLNSYRILAVISRRLIGGLGYKPFFAAHLSHVKAFLL